MISLRESTIDLLLQLHRNGGLIFSTGRKPEFIDGKPGNKKLKELTQYLIVANEKNIAEILSDLIKPNNQISGENAMAVWSQTRQTSDGNMVMLFNTLHTNPVRISIRSAF
jgi:hypothetical protein